jgi:hypothetical protein
MQPKNIGNQDFSGLLAKKLKYWCLHDHLFLHACKHSKIDLLKREHAFFQVLVCLGSVLLDNLKHIWKNKLQILSHSVRKTNCLSSVIKHRPVIEGPKQTIIWKNAFKRYSLEPRLISIRTQK